MTPLRLLLLCLVFLGAGFGLWQLSQHRGERPPLFEVPPKVEQPLMQGDVALLERITLEQPRYGSILRLDKEGDQWMITEPLRDFPEPYAVSFALKVFFGDDWQSAPEEWQNQSNADLGLEPSVATLELRYADGESEILRIGAEEETGRWRVAERNGTLLRFPISPFRQLMLPAEQWRDHRFQPFGANVDRLLWTPLIGEPIEVVQERNKWYLRKPFAAPLHDTAYQYLMQMLGWRVDVLSSTPKKEISFLKPLGTLVLEQSGAQVTLLVNADGIVSDHRAYPIDYSARAFQFLQLSLDELRSNRVLNLDSTQISSVKIEYGDQERLYRLRNGEWVESRADVVVAEQSAFVKALLNHGTLLERGEEVPLPPGQPSGRILFSISRQPQERGSTILRWWVDDQGRNLVAPNPASQASVSTVNFEQGVRSLFGL